MEIFENRKEWLEQYQHGWLSTLEKTGKFDWGLYQRPSNQQVDPSPPVVLSESRLALISTAGAYLMGTQTPFDAPNPLGDYSLRTFPWGTKFSELAIAHDHYRHDAVLTDYEVLLPFDLLDGMATRGEIGEISPRVLSFSGYQPDATRVVDELIPRIIEVVKEDRADAALLVPA